MKFLKKHPISIFLVIGLLVFVLFCWKKLFESTSAEEINYFIFLATGVLAFIAFIEFQRANKLTGNEFLLFLSNRWGCKEIIIARQIIHDFFVHNYRDTTSPVSKDYPGALHHTAKDILNLSQKAGREGKKFIYVLYLIDFLETISFFYSRGDLDIKDIWGTCGHNFIFLHEVFSLYKKQRQNHDSTYFFNIDKLYRDLKKYKPDSF